MKFLTQPHSAIDALRMCRMAALSVFAVVMLFECFNIYSLWQTVSHFDSAEASIRIIFLYSISEGLPSHVLLAFVAWQLWRNYSRVAAMAVGVFALKYAALFGMALFREDFHTFNIIGFAASLVLIRMALIGVVGAFTYHKIRQTKVRLGQLLMRTGIAAIYAFFISLVVIKTILALNGSALAVVNVLFVGYMVAGLVAYKAFNGWGVPADWLAPPFRFGDEADD